MKIEYILETFYICMINFPFSSGRGNDFHFYCANHINFSLYLPPVNREVLERQRKYAFTLILMKSE